MISEAAITDKPIYIGMMKAKLGNRRFRYFYNQFNKQSHQTKKKKKKKTFGVMIS